MLASITSVLSTSSHHAPHSKIPSRSATSPFGSVAYCAADVDSAKSAFALFRAAKCGSSAIKYGKRIFGLGASNLALDGCTRRGMRRARGFAGDRVSGSLGDALVRSGRTPKTSLAVIFVSPYSNSYSQVLRITKSQYIRVATGQHRDSITSFLAAPCVLEPRSPRHQRTARSGRQHV